jgi:16S rRNA processing protein RimM
MRQRLENPVRLGIIVGVRGVKGEVRIKSFTDDPVAIGTYGPLFDHAGARQFDLKVTGTQKGVVLARIDGIADRDAAEALKKTELFVERDQLPQPEEDEFYHSDMEGLEAVSVSGERIGKVVGVFDFGAGPVVEISGNVMIPFTRAAVPEVDIEGGKIVIDPPVGLFEPPGREEDESIEDETT